MGYTAAALTIAASYDGYLARTMPTELTRTFVRETVVKAIARIAEV